MYEVLEMTLITTTKNDCKLITITHYILVIGTETTYPEETSIWRGGITTWFSTTRSCFSWETDMAGSRGPFSAQRQTCWSGGYLTSEYRTLQESSEFLCLWNTSKFSWNYNNLINSTKWPEISSENAFLRLNDSITQCRSLRFGLCLLHRQI